MDVTGGWIVDVAEYACYREKSALPFCCIIVGYMQEKGFQIRIVIRAPGWGWVVSKAGRL